MRVSLPGTAVLLATAATGCMSAAGPPPGVPSPTSGADLRTGVRGTFHHARFEVNCGGCVVGWSTPGGRDRVEVQGPWDRTVRFVDPGRGGRVQLRVQPDDGAGPVHAARLFLDGVLVAEHAAHPGDLGRPVVLDAGVGAGPGPDPTRPSGAPRSPP